MSNTHHPLRLADRRHNKCPPRLRRFDWARRLERLETLLRLRMEGRSMRQCANVLGVNVSTVSRDIRRYIREHFAQQESLLQERASVLNLVRLHMIRLMKIDVKLKRKKDIAVAFAKVDCLRMALDEIYRPYPEILDDMGEKPDQTPKSASDV